eukprot:1154731-Pelagomonas_calceolata.AAC.4
MEWQRLPVTIERFACGQVFGKKIPFVHSRLTSQLQQYWRAHCAAEGSLRRFQVAGQGCIRIHSTFGSPTHWKCMRRLCRHHRHSDSSMPSVQWLDMEQSSERKDDMSEMEDPRVDICIFTIPPHR